MEINKLILKFIQKNKLVRILRDKKKKKSYRED